MTTIAAPTLADLFGASSCDCVPDALEQAVADGYVRRQVHPSEPLAILNYTEKAAYEDVWNAVTETCRGLIYRPDRRRLRRLGRPCAARRRRPADRCGLPSVGGGRLAGAESADVRGADVH